MLTPHDIEQYPLGKAVVGGYKCEDVDNFLDTVAADYQKLYDENLSLTKKITVLVERINEYRKDEEFLKNAMVEAQKIVDNTIRDAQETADKVIAEANKKAEQTLGGSDKRARELDAHFEQMKIEINNFRNQLLNTYKSHIEIISALPIYERSDSVVAEEPVFAEPIEEADAGLEIAPKEIEEMAGQLAMEQSEATEEEAAQAEPSGESGGRVEFKDMSDLAAAISKFNTDAEDDEDTFNTLDFE